jgi:broad specificity phosphatase PhoE
MARAAAEWVQASGRDVTSLTCSPLERTQESAEPFTEVFGVAPRIDERVIEPTNVFEGRRMRIALMNPLNWRHLRKPALPSWGEPYAEVIVRMNQAMTDAWKQAEGGDAVIVSHQLPIWVTHLAAAGESSRHDPRQRRCALSSVTSFEMPRAPAAWPHPSSPPWRSRGRWWPVRTTRSRSSTARATTRAS